MKNQLKEIYDKNIKVNGWKLLSHLWQLLFPIKFLIVVIMVSFVAMLIPNQAHDMYNSFNSTFNNAGELMGSLSEKTHIVNYTIAIILWSLVIWYSARIMLQLLKINMPYGPRVQNYIKWVPRILGIMPYLLTFIALSISEISNKILLLLYAFLAIIYLAFVIFRHKIFNLQEASIRYNPRGSRFTELPIRTQRIIYGAYFLATLILLLLFLPPEYQIATFFQPATIIIIGFILFSMAGMMIFYFDYPYRLPIFWIIMIVMGVFSLFNNNHHIRTIENSENMVSVRPEMETHLQDWLIYHQEEFEKLDSIPIYIIAAEGGGIRGLNWTAGVMHQLESELPNFYEHVYAVSGVSGGAVGALFFHSYYNDVALEMDHNNASNEIREAELKKFQEIISADYLSGVSGALIGPDMLQRFLPFSVSYFDRARWLEDSWSSEYFDQTGHHTLDDPFLSVTGQEGQAVFYINTTVVETGQKAILSNLQLNENYFPEVVDLHKITGTDVPVKTAGLISARFPYITPPGTVKDKNGNDWGNLVDAGYYENTGIETALQVSYQLSDLINKPKAMPAISMSYRKKLQPTVIFIKNDNTEMNNSASSDFMLDILAPPNAFINTWAKRGNSTVRNSQLYGARVQPKIAFISFELDRNTGGKNLTIPLGWFLSDISKKEFEKQTVLLSDTTLKTKARIITEKATHNYKSFQKLQSILQEQ